MRYEFDWDPAKAAANRAKHGISFEEAMSVFLDPLALSILDDAENEERWVIIGQTTELKLLLVVHTFVEYVSGVASVRIISARPPTRREARQYREGV